MGMRQYCSGIEYQSIRILSCICVSARLPTVGVSMATTRCQYQWEIAPQVRCGGKGIPYHVTYPMIHVMFLQPPPPPPEQTDARENIIFPQLRWRAVKISFIKKNPENLSRDDGHKKLKTCPEMVAIGLGGSSLHLK